MLNEYTIDKFYGGISEDDELVGQGQVCYSYNMDLTSNGSFTNVSPDLEIIGDNLSDDIIYMINYTYNGLENILFCGDDNKIYSEGFSSIVYKYTTDRDIIGSWETYEYLFFIDSSHTIYKILKSDISGDWTGKVSKPVNLPGDISYKTSIVSDETYARISVGNRIYTFINADGTAGNYRDFEREVVGLTYSGSTYMVFLKNGKIVLRRGLDDSVLETKSIGKQIDVVKEIANTTYIYSLGAIYVLNGYTLEPLITDTDSYNLNGTKVTIDLNSDSDLFHSKDILYMKNNNRLNIRLYGDGSIVDYFYGEGITTLGRKKTSFPIALNNFIQSEKIVNITSIGMRSYRYSGTLVKNIYIGYEDKETGNKMLGKISNERKDYDVGKRGLLILPMFTGYNGEKGKKKNLKQIKIVADLGRDTNKIELYEAREGNSDNLLYPVKETLEESTVSTDDSEQARNKYEYIIDINKNIYSHQLAIIIRNSYNFYVGNSVRIYSITYVYETIEE